MLEFKGLCVRATSHDFLPYAFSYSAGESFCPLGTDPKIPESALSLPIIPKVPLAELASSESKKFLRLLFVVYPKPIFNLVMFLG